MYFKHFTMENSEHAQPRPVAGRESGISMPLSPGFGHFRQAATLACPLTDHMSSVADQCVSVKRLLNTVTKVSSNNGEIASVHPIL